MKYGQFIDLLKKNAERDTDVNYVYRNFKKSAVTKRGRVLIFVWKNSACYQNTFCCNEETGDMVYTGEEDAFIERLVRYHYLDESTTMQDIFENYEKYVKSAEFKIGVKVPHCKCNRQVRV